MPGTYLNYPFDAEIFLNAWKAEPDLVKTELLKSGVMVNDETIASMIGSRGNFYTIPFYKTLGGEPVNHDGQTNIPSTETEGDSQSGIVYGRDIGWTARDFVSELAGNDPMGHIISSVARFWQKYRQKKMIAILGAVFGITGNAGWTSHTVDITSATAAASKITETALNDLATDTLGDNKDAFSVAIMHSQVARTLENMQILEFWKQTDASGIQRSLKIGTANGFTVIIDDGVPVEEVGGSGENASLKKYTTYLLGNGVLRYAEGRLDVPVETAREPAVNNGQDTLYTRIRETIHPNGFSFVIPSSGWKESPTDAQLANSSNWRLKHDHKAIPMARLITNG